MFQYLLQILAMYMYMPNTNGLEQKLKEDCYWDCIHDEFDEPPSVQHCVDRCTIWVKVLDHACYETCWDLEGNAPDYCTRICTY